MMACLDLKPELKKVLNARKGGSNDMKFPSGRPLVSSTILVMAISLFLVVMAYGADNTVVFSDPGWDSIQVHNRIAGFIFEHGYGREVEYLFVDLTPGLMGLERGDIDLNMELWPTYSIEWWDKARKEGTVVELGVNFDGATQGWYVPKYLIEGDGKRGIEPVVPDLKSVYDLSEYWEVFRDPEDPTKGRLLNGPTGWVAHDINIAKLEGYGLDQYFTPFSPGSGTALDTMIVSAYESGRPILFYYWEPTWILGKYDMVRLDEPPYSEELWRPETNFLCEWVTATTYVAANRVFIEENPDLEAFLRRYSTSLEENQKTLAWLQDHNYDLGKAALWFLQEYPETWKNWIPQDVRTEIIRKVEEKLKEFNK